jgi:hypothetical protein
MIRRRLLGLVVAAAVVAGCATLNVSSHVEQGIDFSQFVTYGWGPADALPTGDPRLDSNPFFKDYLTGAVERALAKRGYRPATDAHPQLVIHFHANVTQRFEVHGVEPRNYPQCSPNCEPDVAEYEDGTIIVDVVNAATNRVIWRGWAQANIAGLIDKQDAMRRHIDKSVTQMFERFPERSAAPAVPPSQP